MPTEVRPDYVLGTHSAEADRLALQNSLWIDEARSAWTRCGLGIGSRVVDVGCGPGLATEALLEIVGATGRVAGIELSGRFAQQARDRCSSGGRTDCEILQCDLMTDAMPAHFTNAFDVAWIRWLAMFVKSPETLIERVRDPADRRRALLSLTLAGAAKLDEVAQVHFAKLQESRSAIINLFGQPGATP